MDARGRTHEKKGNHNLVHDECIYKQQAVFCGMESVMGYGGRKIISRRYLT